MNAMKPMRRKPVALEARCAIPYPPHPVFMSWHLTPLSAPHICWATTIGVPEDGFYLFWDQESVKMHPNREGTSPSVGPFLRRLFPPQELCLLPPTVGAVGRDSPESQAPGPVPKLTHSVTWLILVDAEICPESERLQNWALAVPGADTALCALVLPAQDQEKGGPLPQGDS